ncbi:hypothetical protein [Streptomyces sp. NBC_01789]|uniref:hypothetical protein n=1 Tax=Streptomyces sp. NBC_01789 TaxID=2975941 RepID=UPI0022511374|nr:hypothetical protein [Streptomyces sp. NBC_01789]MCX4451614.1 hypothetical protein [Streptomyces sp. NBC_01789]
MFEISSENAAESTQVAQVAPFTPLVSAESVVTATHGRQTFNDSDKDNYFEG